MKVGCVILGLAPGLPLGSLAGGHLVFLNIEGGEEKHHLGSFANQFEAQILASVASDILDRNSDLRVADLGAITAYSGQKAVLRGLLEGSGVDVDAVDAFQSAERER